MFSTIEVNIDTGVLLDTYCSRILDSLESYSLHTQLQ